MLGAGCSSGVPKYSQAVQRFLLLRWYCPDSHLLLPDAKKAHRHPPKTNAVSWNCGCRAWLFITGLFITPQSQPWPQAVQATSKSSGGFACTLAWGLTRRGIHNTWDSLPFQGPKDILSQIFVLPDMIFHSVVIIIQMAKILPAQGSLWLWKKLAPFGWLSAELHFNAESPLRLRGSGAKYKEMLRIAALFSSSSSQDLSRD